MISILSKRRRTLRLAAPLLCLLLFGAATAQSGRRIPKQNPPAKPSSDSEGKDPEKADNQTPERVKTPLTLVQYLSDTRMSGLPAEAISGSCAERLKASGAFTVSIGREVNRKQASDMAKNSPDTYVVWLEHQIDGSFDPRPTVTGRVDDQNYSVRYVVYIPGTGKSKTEGRVFLRRALTSIPGTGGPLASSYERAGYEIADRVLSAFNVPVPPRL